MYEIAVSVIQDYMDECLFEPTAKWPEEEFNTRSYERWAGNEILERITKESMIFPDYSSVNPTKSIYSIIEDFIDEMEHQAHTTDNKKHHLIFSTARDTAIEIGLLFV
jgi:hypothetical protein